MGMADDAEPGAGDGADGGVAVCVGIAAEVENAGVVVVVMLAVVLLVSTSLS